jgi:aldehyde dehydrogenase (NAD+)
LARESTISSAVLFQRNGFGLSFGPVVVVIPYADEAEAVAIANDSPYGLHGAVFGSNDDHALRVAQQIRTGTCAVNGFGVIMNAPFGGVSSPAGA